MYSVSKQLSENFSNLKKLSYRIFDKEKYNELVELCEHQRNGKITLFFPCKLFNLQIKII